MTRLLSLRHALSGLLLGIVLATNADAAPTCGRLCAAWQLDAEASTDAKAAIDTAVAGYKEEKPKRRRGSPSDFASLAKAELDDSLGPMRERPMREELHKELTHLLVIPESLRISLEGDDVLVDQGHGGPRRFDLDDSWSRVDELGTAEISAKLGSGGFVVREKYKRGRSNREAYVVDTHNDRLVVTRTIVRPKMPDIVLRSVYRPAP